MRDSLISQSEVLKKEADLLLQKSNLLELLRDYGEVRFTGAYRLDLMFEGDIDIHVINPQITKESTVKVLNRLIEQGFFRAYFFGDWVKFRKVKFPKGFYIGLKTVFNQRKWKIDIWFLKKDDPKEIKLMNFIEKNLDSKKRLTILKFKQIRSRKNIEISSPDIYKIVIEKGITNTKDFLKLVKSELGEEESRT